MKELNWFQKEFMETLAAVQENYVQTSLCKNNNDGTLEDSFYDITSEVIINIREVIDGYANSKLED